MLSFRLDVAFSSKKMSDNRCNAASAGVGGILRMVKENTSDGYVQFLPEILLNAVDSPTLMQAFIREKDLVTRQERNSQTLTLPPTGLPLVKVS